MTGTSLKYAMAIALVDCSPPRQSARNCKTNCAHSRLLSTFSIPIAPDGRRNIYRASHRSSKTRVS